MQNVPSRTLPDLVAAYADLRPGAVVVRPERGPVLTARMLDRRANRLARAIAARGLQPGRRVAVLCCDTHAADQAVAYVATLRAGAIAALLPVGAGAADTSDALRLLSPGLVLACAEGTEVWRSVRLPGIVLGDGPGVAWWAAAEGQREATPFSVPRDAEDDAEIVLFAGDGRWAMLERTHREVADAVLRAIADARLRQAVGA